MWIFEMLNYNTHHSVQIYNTKFLFYDPSFFAQHILYFKQVLLLIINALLLVDACIFATMNNCLNVTIYYILVYDLRRRGDVVIS